ncbi:MAG: DUF4412 domain-containing protein [Maribacter sp.]|nr:DUF4412 domain-containing protein [Bacteroidia bacterium]NNK75729.1 DUF4412 domain-containing protein [Maribacter sp.]
MKKRGTLVLIITLLIGGQMSYGQFLKRLKKKTEQAVENVVINKTSNKAAQMAGKGMDKMFNMEFGGQADPSILPESYDFEWKYTLQMKHKKGTMNMNYYLKPDALYFGSQPELEDQNIMAEGMFMVFDQKLNVLTIFMDSENGKAGHVLQTPDIDVDTTDEDIASMEDYTFKEIDTKTILGYECQGFQMENDEMKITMYVALDSPVSFNQVYGGNPKSLPKGFDPKWMEKAENSIMMEMDVVNKKKKKFSAKMTCVTLEKSPKTIVISDYEFMQIDPNAGRE